MVSIQSVRDNLTKASVDILILMQEGDSEGGFFNVEWADEMFDAHELVLKACLCLDRAKLEDR